MTAYEYLDLANSATANSISLLTFGFTVITHSQSFAVLVYDYPEFIRSKLWELPYSPMLIAMTAGGVVACFDFMYDIRSGIKN
jgi:hypothetical protein